MIRLYNYELSGSCYKVRLLLGFLGLDYEKINIDFVDGEHKKLAFLTRNIFGELPVLEDGRLCLRDAQAILVYLASRYDKKKGWYSNNAEEQGLIQQWLATGGGELMSVSGARLAKSLRYPLDIDGLHAQAHRVFTILNNHLRNRMFLELERPTIADIACFPYSALANEAGLDISDYTNLIAWITRMKELPEFTGMPGVF